MDASKWKGNVKKFRAIEKFPVIRAGLYWNEKRRGENAFFFNRARSGTSQIIYLYKRNQKLSIAIERNVTGNPSESCGTSGTTMKKKIEDAIALRCTIRQIAML